MRTLRRILILGGVGVFLTMFLLVPMLSLFWVSFTGEPANPFGVLTGRSTIEVPPPSLRYYIEFFTTPRYYKGLINSVMFSGGVTLGCCIVGVFVALALSRVRLPGKDLLRLVAVVPMAIPPYLVALSLFYLIGKQGIITRFLGEFGIPLNLEVQSVWGAGLAQVCVFFPLVMLTTMAALERMDPSMEEASGVLGAPRDLSFWTVTLPMLLPGIAAGGFLTFIRSFGDFATPKLLMPSQFKLIVVEAYRDMSGNTYWGGAATLSTIMVVFILALLVVQKYIVEGNRFETLTGKGVAEPRQYDHPVGRWVVLALTLGVLAFPLLNLLILILLASSEVWGSGYLPQSWTLANFQEVLIKRPEALLNSLKLSTISLVLALMLATTVSYVIHRTRFWARHVLDFVTLLPFIIPGTAFAIALITVYNDKPLDLHLTVPLLIIAYVVTRSPYGVRSVMAAFAQIGEAMEESSRTLGGTSSLTLWKVLVPLIRPGLVAGGVMIFISCMSDVAITIMICPPAAQPASLAVFELITDSRYGAAAAHGLVLMSFVLIPYLLLIRLSGGKSVGM